ncbi:MAG: ankyrin repeat domain-containing protein [Pirellulaceae bacterium]
MHFSLEKIRFMSPLAVALLVLLLQPANGQPVAPPTPNEQAVLPDRVRDRPEIGKADATEFFQSQKLVQCCEAINEGDADKLKSLLKDKVDLNATGLGGTTLLHWALAKNQFEAFKLLLEHGASPDLALTHSMPGLAGHFIEGDSVLMTAVAFGMSRLKFFLHALPYTKQPNQKRRNGQTILMVYVNRLADVQVSTIEAILQAKVDVNLQDKKGMTACHYAIQWNHANVCVYLIEHGADWTIKDQKGNALSDLIALELRRERTGRFGEDLHREFDMLLSKIKQLNRDEDKAPPRP